MLVGLDMPRSVALFELMYYTALAVGVATFVVLLLAVPALTASVAILSTLVLILLVSVGLGALLVWLAARGRRNWARIALAILFVVNLAFTAFNPDGLQLLGVVTLGSFALQTLLQVGALYQVFRNDSNAWFDADGERNRRA